MKAAEELAKAHPFTPEGNSAWAEEVAKGAIRLMYEMVTVNQPIGLVCFTSKNCEKCPPMKEMFVEVSKELQGDIATMFVDVDDFPDLKDRARIKAVPMVVLYKNGRVKDFLFGIPDAEKLKKKIAMQRD